MENKNYCNKCGKCCSQIAVDFNNRILYRDGIQHFSEDFESFLIKNFDKENVTICECKYLQNNLCTNVNKPKICSDFPSFPFAFIPENCGYEGEMFLKSERIKQRVRKYKEEIIDYEIQIRNGANDKKQLQKIIDIHQTFINKYKQFGSDDW